MAAEATGNLPRPVINNIVSEALKAKSSGEINVGEARFLGDIVANLKGSGPIVEIGTHFGLSAYVMTLFKEPDRPLISVDNFSWNALGLDAARQLEATLHFLRQAILNYKVTIAQANKADFYRQFSGPAPALVFLDADHSYEATHQDLEWAIRIGAETIAGHDYSPQFPGVMRAVDEFGGCARRVGSLWVLKR